MIVSLHESMGAYEVIILLWETLCYVILYTGAIVYYDLDFLEIQLIIDT